MPARAIYWTVYAAAAAVLAWLIVTGALAAHYRQSDPQLVLRWKPADPVALETLAQQALDEQQLGLARRHALSAVVHSPHGATAYRLLGQIARASGDQALARRLFGQAGRLTHRDVALASIFFEDAVREQRWRDAVRYADVVMRRAPRTQGAIVLRLAVLARRPEAAAALAGVLARKPEWRGALFTELASNRVHYPAAAQVISSMRAAKAPIEPAEISPLLTRMVGAGFASQARSLWISGLPPGDRPAADEVYDPTFTDARTGTPFGWSVEEHANSAVALAAPGLRLELIGMDTDPLVRQTLVLPPGQYELESAGRLLEGRPVTLVWQVGCLGAPPISFDLEGPERSIAGGRFEVTGACPVQPLLLRMPARDHSAPSSAVVEYARIRRLG